MRKTYTVIAVLVLICALLCGCSGKDEKVCEWLGTWQTEDISVVADLFEGDTQGTGSVILILTADKNHDPDNTGDYSCEGSITYGGDTRKNMITGHYAVKDGELYVGQMTGTRQGDTLVMHLGDREIIFNRK